MTSSPQTGSVPTSTLKNGISTCVGNRHRCRSILCMSLSSSGSCAFTNERYFQGRAATIAWRRSRGGVGAMGQAFYKGGFEPRMNRKEASLILSLK